MVGRENEDYQVTSRTNFMFEGPNVGYYKQRCIDQRPSDNYRTAVHDGSSREQRTD